MTGFSDLTEGQQVTLHKPGERHTITVSMRSEIGESVAIFDQGGRPYYSHQNWQIIRRSSFDGDTTPEALARWDAYFATLPANDTLSPQQREQDAFTAGYDLASKWVNS